MQSEDISTPIYVECNKMYWSKICVQEFSYIVSGLDIQLEKSVQQSCKQKIGHYMAFAKTANRRKLAYEVVAVNLVNF